MTAPPVRRSLRALLGGIVDYAGLFPPAGLDMPAAVANYAAYRRGPDAWALGRFVLPAARLEEFESAAAPFFDHADGDRLGPWPVAALAGPRFADDAARAQAFNARERRTALDARDSGAPAAVIDTIEVRAGTDGEIGRVAASPRDGLATYVELPVADDPRELVAALARAGLRAKVRAGGVTVDAFPTSAQLTRFIATCIEAGVPFKATAGLHHPLRAAYRLTYEPDSATGTMFGFLNVFLTAALLRGGGSMDDARALLEDSDASAFRVDDDSIAWRGHRFDAADLADMRHLAVSFGSCSFREPMEEMQLLRVA